MLFVCRNIVKRTRRKGWRRSIEKKTSRRGLTSTTATTTKEDGFEDRYLHETYLPTDHFQRSLPTLPIPKLDDTLEKYLYHADPLLDTEEKRNATKNAAEAFATNEGPRLQKQLQEQYQGTYTSYIRKPWFDMYLSARSPLLLNWNPALTFVEDQRKPSQTKRAAALIYSAVVFYRTMRDGKLKPDLFETKQHLSGSPVGKRVIRYSPSSYAFYVAAAMGAYALDMSQYPNLFHSTRVPKPERDELVTYGDGTASSSPPKHVVVQHRGAFYTVDVLDDEGRAIPPARVERALLDVLDRADRNAEAPTVGALTTLPRDEWYSRREELLRNEKNESAISKIDSALFAVCLSDEAPGEDIAAQSRLMLHGDGARDRWLDKSFQLIVTRDAEAAINFEHSWGDGIAVVRFANEIHELSSALDFESASNAAASPTQEIAFDLTSSLRAAVDDAGSRADDMIRGVDFALFQTQDVTSDWVKGHKLSPDGLLQMMMQLAHYGLHGRPGSTYESATTAAFKHGRTETIRSVTPDSLAMCRAFYDGDNDDATKESALRTAVKTHQDVSMRALKGQGMDRHLFVLRHLALAEVEGDESRLPEIFRDEAWSTLSNIILSTSTLPSPALKGGGFGPVGPDCYAVGYGVRKEGCRFSIMTAFDGAQDFADSLDDAMGRVRSVLEK